MSEKALVCLVMLLWVPITARSSTDVIHYSATLEPDIANKSVKGSVLIRVLTTSNQVEFDCGDLSVDAVQEKGKPLEFSSHDHKLRVSLNGDNGEKIIQREIEIKYHGAPKRGIRFFPDRQ